MSSLSIHPASAAPALPGQRLAFGDRRLMLDCGAELSGVTLAYQTYGTLNAEKSNAILVCHALTGDQFVADQHPITGKPGWWQVMVGPGLPIVPTAISWSRPTCWAAAWERPVPAAPTRRRASPMGWISPSSPSATWCGCKAG